MKFKKILLTLGAVFAFSLAACNNNASDSGKTDPTPSGEGSQTETDPTYLKFVGKDKIRIDIMNDELVGKFTYGNAVVDASNNKKDLAYTSSTKIAKRGDITEAVNFIVVIDKEGTDSIAYNKAIEADNVEEFLSDAMVLTGGRRVYVAISTGTNLNWTKGLDTSLDEKLNWYNQVPTV